MKIKIRKNPNGDTRTAPKDVSFEEFEKANRSHRCDVDAVMATLAGKIRRKGAWHDITKVSSVGAKQFYEDFKDTLNNGTSFLEGKQGWWKSHIAEERHHLLAHCPDDVNLLDVLEMIVDCVVAGLARSGEVRPLEINDEILRKAVANTVELVSNMCEVESDE